MSDLLYSVVQVHSEHELEFDVGNLSLPRLKAKQLRPRTPLYLWYSFYTVNVKLHNTETLHVKIDFSNTSLGKNCLFLLCYLQLRMSL